MHKNNYNVYLFAMGHFSVDWVQGAIPALLPYFITACNLNYKEAGTLIFANVLLSSVTQPIFGYYADKISKPWFVPLGPIICGVVLGAMAFTTNYTVLFILSMLSGLGSSLFHPEGALMVNRIAGDKKGQALGCFSVGGNAGFAVGPFLAGLIAYKFNIYGLLIFTGVNLLLAAILFKQIPQALAQAKELHQQAAGQVVAAPTNNWNAFAKLSPVIFARSVGFTISNTFIPIYWIKVLGASPAEGSMALTYLFTAGAVMTYFGGIMADKVGHIKVLRLSFVLMVPAMAALTNSTNLYVALALLVPVAFGLFVPYSPIVVLGQSYLGKSVGLASGITMGLSATIGGVMSPVVGWGADKWGISIALQVLWIAALVGAIFSFIVPKIEKEA